MLFSHGQGPFLILETLVNIKFYNPTEEDKTHLVLHQATTMQCGRACVSGAVPPPWPTRTFQQANSKAAWQAGEAQVYSVLRM